MSNFDPVGAVVMFLFGMLVAIILFATVGDSLEYQKSRDHCYTLLTQKYNVDANIAILQCDYKGWKPEAKKE